MKSILITVILMLGLWTVSAQADMYYWVDVNGVKHYSNEPPPEGARILEKTPETPYNAQADETRTEAERRNMNQITRELDRQAASPPSPSGEVTPDGSTPQVIETAPTESRRRDTYMQKQRRRQKAGAGDGTE